MWKYVSRKCRWQPIQSRRETEINNFRKKKKSRVLKRNDTRKKYWTCFLKNFLKNFSEISLRVSLAVCLGSLSCRNLHHRFIFIIPVDGSRFLIKNVSIHFSVPLYYYDRKSVHWNIPTFRNPSVTNAIGVFCDNKVAKVLRELWFYPSRDDSCVTPWIPHTFV